MVELSRLYDKQSCSVDQISLNQGIPREELLPVVERLKDAGYIKVMGTSRQWLQIGRNPSLFSVYDIVLLFEEYSFRGSFWDDETGEFLEQSSLTKLINKERDSIINYLRTKLGRIKLTQWKDKSAKIVYI